MTVRQRRLAGGVLAICLVAGLALWRAGVAETPAPAAAASATADLVGHGRLEPIDGATRVGVVGSSNAALVSRLLVGKGATVAAGQVLAEIDDADQLRAAIAVAEADVGLNAAKLAQVRLGAKAGDIAAQRAMVQQRTAERKIAALEQQRATALHAKAAMAGPEFNQRQLDLDRAEAQLAYATQTLAAMSEVRATDVDAAAAALAAAHARLDQAQAQLARSIVRAPIAGTVTEIFARTGEQVGADGILELVALDRLVAVAEIDETLVAAARIGQPAEISARTGEVIGHGTVVRIGGRVGQRSQHSGDPITEIDARVVQVVVAPDAGSTLPRIVFYDVFVRLLPAAPGS